MQTTTFDTINFADLSDVTGGFSFGELARATGGGILAGGGAGFAGAATASVLTGGAATPSIPVATAAGAVAGGVGSAINNTGQQLGWWK